MLFPLHQDLLSLELAKQYIMGKDIKRAMTKRRKKSIRGPLKLASLYWGMVDVVKIRDMTERAKVMQATSFCVKPLMNSIYSKTEYVTFLSCSCASFSIRLKKGHANDNGNFYITSIYCTLLSNSNAWSHLLPISSLWNRSYYSWETQNLEKFIGKWWSRDTSHAV